MIREYINDLITENTEKLNTLEQRLNGLLNDLDSAQKWMETLQTEANVDKNIFSPRAMEVDLKGKMEETQNSIDKINQEIEYVKTFMETHLRKKQEYEKLMAELDEKDGNVQSECDEGEKGIADLLKTQKCLTHLYEKTELCLKLLYSDRLKCKNELKDMKAMIQNLADSLQKDEIS